jgi:hypothetical protein
MHYDIFCNLRLLSMWSLDHITNHTARIYDDIFPVLFHASPIALCRSDCPDLSEESRIQKLDRLLIIRIFWGFYDRYPAFGHETDPPLLFKNRVHLQIS